MGNRANNFLTDGDETMDIRKIQWQQALPIRHHVLWPNKPISFCKVSEDDQADHYGVYIEGELVSVASIYINKVKGNDKITVARLRKFATLTTFQGQGIGTRLIVHIINQLKEKGVDIFGCDARKSAVGFYHRFGLLEEGEEFEKSEVMYIKMSANIYQPE